MNFTNIQHAFCKGVMKGKHMTYTPNFNLDRVKSQLCHCQYLRLKNIFNDLENCQAKLNELDTTLAEEAEEGYIIYYLKEGRKK